MGMVGGVFLFASLLSVGALAADTRDSRCAPPAANEPHLVSSDFPWNQSLEEMRALYERTYSGEKRLYRRAYYDARAKKYFLDVSHPEGTRAEVPTNFIRSVTKHVENALKKRFADFLFFPDMGHSHFFVPNAVWEKVQDLERDKLYEALFKTPGLKVLYHTAEQLKVREGERSQGAYPQDEKLLWRYFTRNLFGTNDGSDTMETLFAWGERYNTHGGELEGYRYYGGGFNISANKNACFPFQVDGKTYYFDLSLEDLPSSGDTGGGW